MSDNIWTIENLPDLHSKVIIVTGGNSGIGFESVAAFASKGAKVIMASRSLEKAANAINKIKKRFPSADIKAMELDLANLKSIKNFAVKFNKEYSSLDVLLNNAGIMSVPYCHTIDGFEQQMGTNHFGHFALTGLLLDIIRSTPGSRVVNVSSIAHKKAHMDFDNLLFENGRDYNRMGAYRRSKLANLYFTFELQRFFESHACDCIALAAHPGVTDSNIARSTMGNTLFSLLKPLITLALQKTSIGALPQIRASVDPLCRGGEYYGPDNPNEWSGYPVLVEPSRYAQSEENSRRLWEMSEELTGVKFQINH